MALIGIGGIVTFIAVILMVISGKILLKGGWLFAWVRGTSGLIIFSFAFLLLLAVVDLSSYSSPSPRMPIATFSFTEKSKQLYHVELIDQYGDLNYFDVAGDQWQLSVRQLMVMGFPSYKLETLSGRYLSLEQNARDIRSHHDIWNSQVSHFWRLIDGVAAELPFIEETSVSVSYVPMKEGAIFRVELGSNGILVEPANAMAREIWVGE